MRLVYLTNENRRTVAEWVQRLRAVGIPAAPQEILTSALLAARYVKRHYPERRILPVGTAGLVTALREQGLTLVERPEEAEVVVMGRAPGFDTAALDRVCQAIWGGAVFVATNLDRCVPVEGRLQPAAGPMIQAVAWATGVEPVVVGKPSRWAAEMALELLGIAPIHGAVVGDQLEQDVRMGKQAGLQTVLVLSGATRADDVLRRPEDERPDAVLPDITHLPRWLDAIA
jgi:4-nitrophenyl phosphatase